jgi:hypothetical protein
MLVHGFTIEQMVELVLAGLATASAWSPARRPTRWRACGLPRQGGRRWQGAASNLVDIHPRLRECGAT